MSRKQNKRNYQEPTTSTPVQGDEEQLVVDQPTPDIEEQVVEEVSQVENTAPVVETVEEVKEPTVQEPIIEQKPIVKREGVLIMIRNKSTDMTTSADVEKLNVLCTQYINTMTIPSFSEENRAKSIALLVNIANHVLNSKDTRVYEAFHQFMIKNRAIMLTSERVTSGMQKYVPNHMVTRLIRFYVTFHNLAESRLTQTRFRINVTAIRRVFGNDTLANWFISQSSK